MAVGRSLVAQKIAVCARVVKFLVAFPALFADGEGYRAIGKARSYLANDIAYAFVGELRILAALKHEGTESELIALFTAIKYLLF